MRKKELDFVGAIDPGGLQEFLRNTLDRGREQHHRITGLQPQYDHHQEEIVPRGDRRVVGPAVRMATEGRDDRVEQPNLRCDRAD